MASSPSSVRPRTILILAGALAGAAVAVYNYLTPLTGVTGSLGALIVIASSILLIIAGVLIQLSQPGGWRSLLRTLVVLGAIGTGLAAYFLHEWWLIVAMVIVLVGVVLDVSTTRSAGKGATA
ncbi:hypothetical protein [Allosediminivita pacifica]|uniref:Uncharacterized protein n=1 Tax=Allosediminivita pacifica TaxID=1267769 RepID=A0A2T6AQE9_9RHOB|nr:hypothetical protein [Allosediminivita pacifica]PTX46055.1 hypothetical protein C8N44_11830 [Allosediminivita pacifica]GGB18684.1 hypothetical protein GCM10011324_31040 [Allosediminivita pacifica]